ncbi:MAG: translocation/assembly module TamB domain-containing protein [Myxococcota bacterium]
MRGKALIQKLVAAFGLACLFVVASVFAFGVHLDLPRGRRLVSSVVGKLLAGELRGGFSLAGVERLRPGGAVVRDFEVRDERGRPVLRVSRVTLRAPLVLMLRDLLTAPERAQLVFDAVELEHAEAYLFDDDRSGVPSLARAFMPRPRPPSRTPSPPSTLKVSLRSLSLSHGYVRGRVGGIPTLELEVNQLRGSSTITEQTVELELGRFGVVARGIGGADARGVGALRLHEPGWVWTSFDGYFGDVQVGSVLRVDGDTLSASVSLPRASPAAMRGLLPAYPLQKDAVLHVEANGKLSELAVQARLEVEDARFAGSGPLRLSGDPSLALDVTATRLDAAALVAGLPPTRLDANAHVQIDSAPNKPSVSVRAVSLPGEVDRLVVPAAEVEATLQGSTLTGNALLHEPGLPVRATFQLRPGGIFDLHAESNSVDLARAPRLKGLPGQGIAGLRFDAHVEGGKLRLTANGDVRDYRRDNLTFGRAVFEARANGPLSDWRALAVDARVKGDDLVVGGLAFVKVDARATGALGNPRVEFALDDPRGGKLALAANLGVADGTTRVQKLSLGYRREQAELSGSLGSLNASEEEIELRDLELRGLGGELKGSLTWKRNLISVDASGKHLRLGDLARLLGLPSHYASGTLDFDTEILLARDIERGKINLTLTDGSVGPLPDVTSSLNAVLEDGRLQGDLTTSVRNVADSSARFDVHIPGSVRNAAALRDTIGEANLEITRINLGLLSQVLAPGKTPPIQGSLALALKATRRVPYALPSLELGGITNGLAIEPALLGTRLPPLRGVDAQFGINLSGESGAADASLKLLDNRGALASASLSTTIDLVQLLKDPYALVRSLPDAPLVGKLLIDERQLSEFPKDLVPLIGEGRVRVEATLTGTANKPVLAGRLRLAGFELAKPAGTRPLDICAGLAWDHATQRLGSNGEIFLSSAKHATCQGPRVALYTVLGALTPQTPGAPRLEGSAVLSLERLPIDAIPGFGETGITGRLSGKASFTQNGPIPAFSANLTLRDAQVRDVAVGDGKLEVRSNEQALGLTLELKKGTGTVQATALAALDYSGLFPALRGGEPIGLRVTAQQADAVILSPFVKDVLIDLTGTLNADVTARIGGTSPNAADTSKIQGTLSLHRGSFEVSGLGLKLQDVDFAAQAEAEGAQTRISVPLLIGHSTKGQRAVAVRGAKVWLAGLELARAEGTVDASELPLTLPGIPQATATTRQSIAFNVRRTAQEMQANISVPYLVVALPQAAARDLISLDENRSIEIIQPITQPGQGSGDGLPWRFGFDLGQNVKLTRPDLDLPLSGHAEVLLARKVEVTGDIELSPGGRIDVSGKTFVVETGEVHFDTGDASNPRIRVTAIFRPPDGSVITAEVSGTLKQATLSLSSPTKDLQQIYAVLLGGSGGTGGGDARAAGAGVGADQLLGPLLANTPLRKVELRTGSELSADRRSYSTYSAAVPLSEQVWFEGSYKTLNSQDSRVQGSAVSGTIDFRFRRNWSLRTEVGTIGTGVDLLWNYRY